MSISKFKILFLVATLIFSCQSKESNPQKEMNTKLLLNHTGYQTNGLKKVILQTKSDEIPEDFKVY